MPADADNKSTRHAQAILAQAQRRYIDGRGDMVSENSAANTRFQRNSEALQQRQAVKDQGHLQPAKEQSQARDGKAEIAVSAEQQHRGYNGLKQEQARAGDQSRPSEQKKELSFGPGRETQQDKSADRSQAAKAEKGQEPSRQGNGKQLSFGEGREGRGYDALKQEHSSPGSKDRSQRGEQSRELAFGPGRQPGQEHDQSRGR